MADVDGPQPGRQVNRGSPVGIIGAGRLGSSLAQALSRAGYPVVAVSTRRTDHSTWLSERLPGTQVTADPQQVADSATVVFIVTADTSIKPVADAVRWHAGHAVIHCSGAAPVSLLDSAVAQGATAGGFHPLQTFPSPEATSSFSGIAIGIEATDPALDRWLRELASNLGAYAIEITAGQRPAYHASAVMACGLLAGLTGLAAEVWSSAGSLSRSEATAALTPLVKSTANWIGEKGLPAALTGPYVRGDVTTVKAHTEATADVSAEHGAAYSALALAALHIAEEQGGLSFSDAENIREVLLTALRANCEIIDRP